LQIDPKTAAVWDIVEPVALELGLELVDVEHRREGHGAVLRLLLDRPGGGVTIDELTDVSRQVSDILDVHEDAVAGAYTLEVSSPGINRPLTRPAHFPPFIGKRVHVKTRRPVGDRHSFRGVLTAAGSEGITITADDQHAHEIPFDEIARAHYQHEFPAVGKRRALSRRGGARPTAHSGAR
jgi:ribosome maturation factor RimP